MRRKAFGEDLSMRELEPEYSSEEHSAHRRVMQNVVCACALGIWLSSVVIRRSTDSLPHCESSGECSGAVGGWQWGKIIQIHLKVVLTLVGPLLTQSHLLGWLRLQRILAREK